MRRLRLWWLDKRHLVEAYIAQIDATAALREDVRVLGEVLERVTAERDVAVAEVEKLHAEPVVEGSVAYWRRRYYLAEGVLRRHDERDAQLRRAEVERTGGR